MERRSFLGMLIAAPAIAATAVAAEAGVPVMKKSGLQLSCRKNEPGYLEYCMAMADRKNIKIFVNGDEIKYCISADEKSGTVVHHPTTEAGNLCHDGEELYEGTIYGDVKIVIS